MSWVTALTNITGIAGCSSFSLDSPMAPVLMSHRAPWGEKIQIAMMGEDSKSGSLFPTFQPLCGLWSLWTIMAPNVPWKSEEQVSISDPPP
jgi:hypothetical protein